MKMFRFFKTPRKIVCKCNTIKSLTTFEGKQLIRNGSQNRPSNYAFIGGNKQQKISKAGWALLVCDSFSLFVNTIPLK